MKQRIAALILALGLTAGLAACGPKTPAPEDETLPPPPSPRLSLPPLM